MPTCSDVMTRQPICCEPGDSVSRVAEIMKQQDVGSLPVVDSHSSRRLVGIITDRDLVTKIVAGHREVATATVQDAMTSNPASCGEDEDVNSAVSLMAERQVRRMPVVDRQGRLTGIIAQADIATRIHRASQTAELVEAVSEPATHRR